jgi:membrane protein
VGKPTERPDRKPDGRFGWLSSLALGVIVGASLSAADRYRASRGGGATAAAPWSGWRKPAQTGASGWKTVLLQSFKGFGADKIPAAAGGVTFFALLALFPALSAFASLYGLFADLSLARRQVEGLTGLLPGGAIGILTDQLTRLAQAKHVSLGAAFAISFLISIWSSNAGVKALIAGLNDAFEKKEQRGFLALNGVSMAFTVGVVLFTVLAVSAIVAAPETLQAIGLSALAGAAFARWPAILLAVALLISLLYRFGPSGGHGRWRLLTPGGGFAALCWLVMSAGFSWYVANFGHYDRTYGSLGAVVGFMTWIWLSVMVVLFGAELNAALERRASVDNGAGLLEPPIRQA